MAESLSVIGFVGTDTRPHVLRRTPSLTHVRLDGL